MTDGDHATPRCNLAPPRRLPKAESFMKTPQVEAAYLAADEPRADITADLPSFINEVHDETRLHPALVTLGRMQFKDQHVRQTVDPAA